MPFLRKRDVKRDIPTNRYQQASKKQRVSAAFWCDAYVTRA
jgi:hypothetical protein